MIAAHIHLGKEATKESNALDDGTVPSPPSPSSAPLDPSFLELGVSFEDDLSRSSGVNLDKSSITCSTKPNPPHTLVAPTTMSTPSLILSDMKRMHEISALVTPVKHIVHTGKR